MIRSETIVRHDSLPAPWFKVLPLSRGGAALVRLDVNDDEVERTFASSREAAMAEAIRRLAAEAESMGLPTASLVA